MQAAFSTRPYIKLGALYMINGIFGEFNIGNNPWNVNNADNNDAVKNNPLTETQKGNNVDDGQCTTCSERRYVDQSDDSSVSFQTPTNVSPEQSFAQVSAHEQEHVTNDRKSAEEDGGEVLYQSVSYRMASCPECGKYYISGGTTKTVSKHPVEKPGYDPEKGNIVDKYA